MIEIGNEEKKKENVDDDVIGSLCSRRRSLGPDSLSSFSSSLSSSSSFLIFQELFQKELSSYPQKSVKTMQSFFRQILRNRQFRTLGLSFPFSLFFSFLFLFLFFSYLAPFLKRRAIGARTYVGWGGRGWRLFRRLSLLRRLMSTPFSMS